METDIGADFVWFTPEIFLPLGAIIQILRGTGARPISIQNLDNFRSSGTNFKHGRFSAEFYN